MSSIHSLVIVLFILRSVFGTSVATVPSTIPIKKSKTKSKTKSIPHRLFHSTPFANEAGDEFLSIPEGMSDTDPTTETVFQTPLAIVPSTLPIKKSKTKSKTKSIPHRTLHFNSFANDKASNDDIVLVTEGMFDTDPFSVIVVPSGTSISHHSSIKVKPTSNFPALLSNTYECLTNDNNDDNDAVANVDRTVEFKKVPRTGTTVKRRNNKKKTKPARDESGIRRDADTRPVVVKTRELQNIRTKKKQPLPSAIVDLGTMITTNKGIPGVDNEDDASAMTGTTKNSEKKYNQQIDIPEVFFDTDTTTEVEHPTNRKKHWKHKPHQNRTQRYGNQAANSNEGTGG